MMRYRSPLLMGLVALALFGCVSAYKPPSAQEPHALLKFRRRYAERPGSSLREVLRVDGHWAFRKTDLPMHAALPRTDAVLVHPGEFPVEMIAVFSHQEMQAQQESYSCGSTSAPRTCYRTVQRSVTVTDGQCKRERTVQFESGKNYVIELDYQDARNCSARCMEQQPAGEGKFKNVPCR
jgi:hypothetical protein